MTARELATLLADAGVQFDYDAGEIGVTGLVPPELEAAAVRLKTGLAALASGRHWYALTVTGVPVLLDPGELVPESSKFLRVGDSAARWNRVPIAARLDLPHLFAPPSTPSRGKR